jgi:hypothetical protein
VELNFFHKTVQGIANNIESKTLNAGKEKPTNIDTDNFKPSKYLEGSFFD